MRLHLTLVLLETGGAELIDEDQDPPPTLWASDSDEHFWDQWDGEFLCEEDEEDVWDYLIDEGIVTEAEAESAALEVEEYTEDDIPEAIAAGDGHEDEGEDDYPDGRED